MLWILFICMSLFSWENITEHTLDFVFLTENWLDQNNSAAVLIESTRPGYSFISEARVSRRGGSLVL